MAGQSMARKPTQQQQFDALMIRHEAEIAAAMLAAFADLRDNADQAAVTTALERRDTEGAIRALHLDPAAFHPMETAERDAFIAAGLLAIASLPALTDIIGRSIVVRFNPAASTAASALNRATTQTTTRLMADQVAAIRALVAERLAANADPASIALEIVGRINPATGAREGGIIGISSSQAQYVQTAADELASTDTALLRNYLTRTLRDSRFDAAVRDAIESGKPVSQAIADRAVQSYSNRLLLARGRTVGLAQAQQMYHAGQDAAFDQVAASGALGPGDVIMGTWRQVPRPTAREAHAELNGESQPHGVPFRSPTGALMMYPGDTSLGAGAEDVANCLCSVQKRIVFRSNEQRSAA